jgi:hypothetical protein
MSGRADSKLKEREERAAQRKRRTPRPSAPQTARPENKRRRRSQLRGWAARDTAHRLTKSSVRRFGLSDQHVGPITQFDTLLDKLASGIADLLRSSTHFFWQYLAAIEVAAQTLGHIGATTGTHEYVVAARVRSKFSQLKTLSTTDTLRRDVAPAIHIEESALFRGQFARPEAV